MTVGLSDGIIVLLALTAGLGRVVSEISTIYIAAAIAILVGSISIAVSRYYTEKEGMEDAGHDHHDTIALQDLGFREQTLLEITSEMQKEEKSEFEKVVDASIDIQDARKSAANIALFYAVGGLFPLIPYMLVADRATAFIASAIVSVLCLVLVGYIKAVERSRGILSEILRQSIAGILAASAGYFLGGIFL